MNQETFAPGKNAKELGIDTSRVFEVVEGNSRFRKGEKITLKTDDNTLCPWFWKEDKSDYWAIKWSDLKYADEQSTPHWKKYIGTKTAVRCKDREELENVVDKRGFGEIRFIISDHIMALCAGLKEGLNHGDFQSEEYYKNLGYTIISFEEFMEEEENQLKGLNHGKLIVDELAEAQRFANKAHDMMLDEMLSYQFKPIYIDKAKLRESKLVWQVIDFNKPNIIKKTMSNIVKFAKDITLSADEKELREAGLQDGDGSWTGDADKIIFGLIAKESGFKNENEMSDKYKSDNGLFLSTLEMHTAYTKYYAELLEIAKKYNKENKDK